MYLFVKAVGVLPVALAIFSFLFLVLLLSYHTIRQSFGQLELDKKGFLEAGKKLYAAAGKLTTILQEKGDFLNNYDTIISLAGTLHSQQVEEKDALRANILLKQELEVLPTLIQNLTVFSDTENRDIQQMLQEMQEAEKQYQLAYRKYAYNLRYYNSFVEKLPSKWAAQLAGYKKQ